LEGDNQHRLVELVKQSPGARAAQVVPIGLTIPDLEAVSIERISTLEPEEVSIVLQRTKHPAPVKRAVDLYCSSKSWDQANSRYARVIEPILDSLSSEDISRILSASTKEGADLNGAHSFVQFARYVYENERLPKEKIIDSLRANHMDWIADQLVASPEDGEIPF
jgi:hypothetical protein